MGMPTYERQLSDYTCIASRFIEMKESKRLFHNAKPLHGGVEKRDVCVSVLSSIFYVIIIFAVLSCFTNSWKS